mmetsp:Transcript_14282/g.40203  ORF Transcript_14282/g.40203 Transcript_14282/m.40203 type:complete len:248 (+) Transcript_14282:474-1217(+)
MRLLGRGPRDAGAHGARREVPPGGSAGRGPACGPRGCAAEVRGGGRQSSAECRGARDPLRGVVGGAAARTAGRKPEEVECSSRRGRCSHVDAGDAPCAVCRGRLSRGQWRRSLPASRRAVRCYVPEPRGSVGSRHRAGGGRDGHGGGFQAVRCGELCAGARSRAGGRRGDLEHSTGRRLVTRRARRGRHRCRISAPDLRGLGSVQGQAAGGAPGPRGGRAAVEAGRHPRQPWPRRAGAAGRSRAPDA